MKSLARCSTVVCTCWMLLFILSVQSSTGKAWFKSLAGMFSSTDSKGPVPMLCLSIPILWMGSVCAFCLRIKQQQGGDHDDEHCRVYQRDCNIENLIRHCTRTFMRRILRTHQRLPLWVHDCRVLHHLKRRLLLLRSFSHQSGDRNMDHAALTYIVLPLSIYSLQGIWRLLNDLSSTENKPFAETLGSLANIFGLMALVALSILLVPVARHSPLLKLLGWSPAVAVRLHQWTGRVVIIGGLLHGLMYLYRWTFLENQPLTSLLLPPTSCWTVVRAKDEDGACYKPLRNLTGLVALCGIVTIAITSLEVVRRSFFAAFYTCHLVAGPLVFVMAVLHWNRSFLYLGGGLLYYMATTLAVYYEGKMTLGGSSKQCGGGVRILSVERIRCVKDSCVSLTFQASVSAIERFRASQYVNMLVPEVSMISHPFTINIVPENLSGDVDNDKSDVSTYKNTYRMQVIFREMGPFTRQLSSRLMDSRQRLPLLSLDGFHGPADRLQVALEQHDVVVFVAGGIGITPYLTMLYQVHENLSSSFTWEAQKQQQPMRRPPKFSLINSKYPFKTKKIVLHWICRDEGLIEYVQREYFSSLLKLGSTRKRSSAKAPIQIIIHRTSTPLSDQQLQSGQPRDSKKKLPETLISARRGIAGATGTTPFRPSKFAAASKKTYLANLPLLTSFCVIGWLGLFIVWACYSTIQDKKQLGSRSVNVIVLFCLLPVAAKMINSIFTHEWEDRMEESFNEDSLKGSLVPSSCDDRASYKVGLEPADMPSKDNGITSVPVVTMEERDGRPSIQDLLDAFDEDHFSSPAMYACGPTLLMQRIQRALHVRERCCRRAQRRNGIVPPSVAYYEESFEI